MGRPVLPLVRKMTCARSAVRFGLIERASGRARGFGIEIEARRDRPRGSGDGERRCPVPVRSPPPARDARHQSGGAGGGDTSTTSRASANESAGFSGAKAAPNRAAAKNTSSDRSEMSVHDAMRSPGTTPWPDNTRATRLAPPSTSAKVTDSSSSVAAMLRGESAAARLQDPADEERHRCGTRQTSQPRILRSSCHSPSRQRRRPHQRDRLRPPPVSITIISTRHLWGAERGEAEVAARKTRGRRQERSA